MTAHTLARRRSTPPCVTSSCGAVVLVEQASETITACAVNRLASPPSPDSVVVVK
jgi:hypothetical protein